jgi:eukaryotic-like serine/threonine-protein kinase
MDKGKQLEDALFFAALHIADREERKEFLDCVCRDDPAMRRMIENLLAAGDAGDKLVERGFAAIANSAEALREMPADAGSGDGDGELIDDRIGTHIGPYTLLESLGKGGCGEVYLAGQTEPVKRQVALKVIKLGMDTQSVIRRFDAERRALAMMDHPNIARVLDAGSTVLGRPYFVLELVRGVRITDYCNQHGSDLRQRVGLLIEVCQAIQHAHQKGIIHRDIKPSNVLVAEQDGVPVPKVIDFGIAKAIEGRIADETFQTQHFQLLGTPAYMSPEQAGVGGLDVDTRSDIYSLGALLYELVTGRPPFDTGSSPVKEAVDVRRMLAEQEPKRASLLLAQTPGELLPNMGSLGVSDPTRLAARVRGDLDWIIMRAMEKEPSRRYDTVNGMALDLRRFLNDEPVAARPPARLYVLRKLIRRNRIVFAFSALVVILLGAGFGVSTLLYLRASRAEHRQAELRRTAEKALATEARLRRDAETREGLTEAVVLTRQGDFASAALVLGQLDVPPGKPSLDAVTALRDVGQWLGAEQRWAEATKCFAWLFDINILDRWQTVTLDFQAYGALLADSGDRQEYARFCETLALAYENVTDGDEAGRILKSCLLRPLDAKRELQLQPLAVTIRKWYPTIPQNQRSVWASLPLSLWRYRTGDFSGAIEFANAAIPGSNATMAHRPTHDAVIAMASHALGDAPAAKAHLEAARDAVERRFASPLGEGSGSTGYWYDWLFARVLVREASELIEGRR